MEDCVHYWHTSCLLNKSATVERLENANGDPVGYDVVKGECCKYNKCPYKEWVGTNNQNKSTEMKTTDLETSKLLQELKTMMESSQKSGVVKDALLQWITIWG